MSAVIILFKPERKLKDISDNKRVTTRNSYRLIVEFETIASGHFLSPNRKSVRPSITTLRTKQAIEREVTGIPRF